MIISLTTINRVAVKCHISSKLHKFSIKKYKSFCKVCCLLLGVKMKYFSTHFVIYNVEKCYLGP